MDLKILGMKINEQLSPDETTLLVKALKENPEELLNAIESQTDPSLAQEQFIADVRKLTSEIVQKHGYEDGQKLLVLQEYGEQFGELSAALSLLDLSEIKAILTHIAFHEDDRMGPKMVTELLNQLVDVIPFDDFNLLLNDEQLSKFFE